MKRYRAIAGYTSRIIRGAETPQEALVIAIKAYNDCVDHVVPIEIYDMKGNWLCGEDESESQAAQA